MAINHKVHKNSTAQGTAVATTSVAKHPLVIGGEMLIVSLKDFYKLLPEI